MNVDMNEILGLAEDVEIKPGEKNGGGGKRGKWKRDLILQVAKWVADNCEPNRGKAYAIEHVYDLFYSGDEEHKEQIFTDPERLKSFVNTFMKTVNTLAKSEGINVRVKKRGNKVLFIKLADTTETADVEEE